MTASRMLEPSPPTSPSPFFVLPTLLPIPKGEGERFGFGGTSPKLLAGGGAPPLDSPRKATLS